MYSQVRFLIATFLFGLWGLCGPAVAATFNIIGSATYDESSPAFASVFGGGTIDFALEIEVESIGGNDDITAASGTFNWTNDGDHEFVSDSFHRTMFGSTVSIGFVSAAGPTVDGLTVNNFRLFFNFGGPVPAAFSGLLLSTPVSGFGAEIEGPGFGTAFGAAGFAVDAVVASGPLPDPDPSMVPLPASGLAFLSGLAGLLLLRRRS